MHNTMRTHSAGQISMEGGVDVKKGYMVMAGNSFHLLLFVISSQVELYVMEWSFTRASFVM